MPESSPEPSQTLASLKTSFASLENAFSALHSRPWTETIESLSTLERVKMDILIAYAINDLIWGKLSRLIGL